MTVQSVDINSLYEPIIQALKNKQYVDAEKLSIQFLQMTKIIPQAWVFLGQSLLGQGIKHGAQRAFQRALLIDPLASWEKAAQLEINKLADDEPKMYVEKLLEVKRVTVCAAMIVKNEIRCIRRCIDSLLEAVDEIVVLDTGSTDGTIEILQQYPQIKLYHYTWSNDFSAARNEALQYVASDWVCWIDADHRLHPEDVTVVREAAGVLDEVPFPAVYIIGEFETIRNSDTPNYHTARMFAMRHQLRYWGKIHEQIGAKNGRQESRLLGKPIRIRYYHDGYDPQVIQDKKKLERNIILLKEMIQEEPDNPAWWMFYGRETLAAGDVDTALNILLEAEQKAIGAPWYGRILDIHMYLLKIYLSRDEIDHAEAVCTRALEAQPDFPDALYWLGQIKVARAKHKLQLAQQHLDFAKQGFHSYRGTVTADHQIHEFKADQELEELTARLDWKEN